MLDELILPPFPMPPSTNDAYADIVRPGRGGKHYVQRLLTREGTAYKQVVSQIMNDSGFSTKLREFIEYHVTVDVWLYVYKHNWFCKNGVPKRPNKNAGDADNRIKLLQDTLFNCTGIDDCSAFFSGARKMPHPEGEPPKVIVRFTKTPDVLDEFG